MILSNSIKACGKPRLFTIIKDNWFHVWKFCCTDSVIVDVSDERFLEYVRWLVRAPEDESRRF